MVYKMSAQEISLAVGLQSGEIATCLLGRLENHPFLDLCGVARSVPDLLRLLERFRPAVLLISHALLEEMGRDELEPSSSLSLSRPLTFLLSGPGITWSDEDLKRVLALPLRFCGSVDMEPPEGEDLYAKLKPKVELQYKGAGVGQAAGIARGTSTASADIAVTGAKGGVGSTLISCMLASSLASSGRRILLMDMDRELSQTSHLRSPERGKTASELMPLAQEISWDLVRISVQRHPSGFHLLPHGCNGGLSSRPGREIPEEFLRNLSFVFDSVVFDFPRPLNRFFLPLLRRSPVILLISTADILSARCARKVAEGLLGTGLDKRRLKLVVNRCGSHPALGPEELSSAVGAELLACLPEDRGSGADFAELGELPGYDSPLGTAVRSMAASLGFEVPLQPKDGRQGILKHLLGIALRSIGTGNGS